MPDIPAYGEGETEDDAVDDLKEAIRGYIETFGLEDALSRQHPVFSVKADRSPPRKQGTEAIYAPSVPVRGNRPLKLGTLRGILRDIQMSPAELAQRLP